MARLYANENFPLPVVEALDALGHDVLTSATAGNAGRAVPDEEVLRFARAENRALLTLNRRHFMRLVRGRTDHPGLIACTFDPDFGRQARAIHALIADRSDLSGQVLRVYRPS
jgi:hypothetical protein